MAFFKEWNKTDALALCCELECDVSEDMTMGELQHAVVNSYGYEEEFTRELYLTLSEERRVKEANELELEKLRLKVKEARELEKLRLECKAWFWVSCYAIGTPDCIREICPNGSRQGGEETTPVETPAEPPAKREITPEMEEPTPKMPTPVPSEEERVKEALNGTSFEKEEETDPDLVKKVEIVTGTRKEKEESESESDEECDLEEGELYSSSDSKENQMKAKERAQLNVCPVRPLWKRGQTPQLPCPQPWARQRPPLLVNSRNHGKDAASAADDAKDAPSAADTNKEFHPKRKEPHISSYGRNYDRRKDQLNPPWIDPGVLSQSRWDSCYGCETPGFNQEKCPNCLKLGVGETNISCMSLFIPRETATVSTMRRGLVIKTGRTCFHLGEEVKPLHRVSGFRRQVRQVAPYVDPVRPRRKGGQPQLLSCPESSPRRKPPPALSPRQFLQAEPSTWRRRSPDLDPRLSPGKDYHHQVRPPDDLHSALSVITSDLCNQPHEDVSRLVKGELVTSPLTSYLLKSDKSKTSILLSAREIV